MMSLSEVATDVKGELVGRDICIRGVSTDTRTIGEGELFVALSGPSFDGHGFVDAARDAGAAAAMVQADIEPGLPVVRVTDTRKALGALGGTWRSRFSIPVVAVTGSNGKTTVKEMIGSIMTVKAPSLISSGNLNNEIGVPLVLCRLRPEHQHAVIELGMNHPGEIGYLSRLSRPTVVVITNASTAHLEGLGTVESVADAKGEIMSGLGAGGVAVLNRDDPFYGHWLRMAAGNMVLSFGFDEQADVRASEYSESTNNFRLHIRERTLDVTLPLAGRHNIANALAAAAAAFAIGMEPDQIGAGLARVQSVSGRLCARSGINGALILDDSYNANPASVAAGIDVLAARPGRRIAVLGDMAELGAEARALHEQVGRHARDRGIDELHGYGDMIKAAVEAFGAAGFHHDDRDELVGQLKATADGDTTFLIKGSRSMRMDRVVDALIAPARKEGRPH